MQQIFQNGHPKDDRRILIKIEDEFIAFYFYEYYLRHNEWLNSETERRLDCGEEDLSEEEKYNNEFYWIPKDDWISDRTTTRQGRDDNWHKHMMRKAWFTEEMKYFIDKHTI